MKKFLFVLFSIFFASNCYANNLYSEIFHKINLVRKNNGLPTLVLNDKLMMAAQSQSDWMASVGKMSHLRHHPSSLEEFRTCDWHPANRVVNAGYFDFDELFDVEYKSGGASTVHPRPAVNQNVDEIIAAAKSAGRQGYDTNVIMRGWMNSPGHRKAILTPTFKEFGIGISSPRPGDVYWCVVFGNR